MNPHTLRLAYDRFADRYGAVFAAQQIPKIRALLAHLPTPLPQPAVDLGAGIGLAGRLSGAPLISLDLSAVMLSYATGPRVQADLGRLPFADGSLGCALSVTSLIGFVDAAPAVGSVAAALRPGALWALSVLKSEDLPNLERALRGAGLAVEARLQLGADQGWVVRRGGSL